MSDEMAGDWSERLAAAWVHHRERLFSRHREVSRWLIEGLRLQPGQTLLELAAGPGETGFLAAERLGPCGRLISTDLVPQMVDAARNEALARGLGNVECRVMDAQDIDLPNASVDAVLCRFGLMLVPEPDRALREIRRVLRPGGRLAYAVFGAPQKNPLLTATVAPIRAAGFAPGGDPTGPGGVFSLAAPERNEDLLAAAGFSDVHVDEVPESIHFDDVDDFWEVQSTVSGAMAVFIQSLTAQQRAAVRDAVPAAIAPFATRDGYEFSSLALAITAA